MFSNEWEFIPIDEFHIAFRMTHRTYYIFRWISEWIHLTWRMARHFLSFLAAEQSQMYCISGSIQFNWMEEGWWLAIRRTTKKYGIFFFVFCIVRMRVGHFVITHVTCVAFDNTMGLKISNIRPSNKNRKNKHSEYSSLNEWTNERTSKFCPY